MSAHGRYRRVAATSPVIPRWFWGLYGGLVALIVGLSILLDALNI